MRRRRQGGEAGFTIVELTVTMVIISIVMISLFGLFVSLVNSTVIAKRRAVAVTLATSQMENLKALPYDSLTVQAPTSSNQTLNGVRYTVKTIIEYVDDAYDGCANYANLAQKQLYCRNYPPPSGAPATDLNPADYKIINVAVTDKGGATLASVDTQISSQVSETASTTGALFVTVNDAGGSALSGATVSLSNSTLTPGFTTKVDDTDSNGLVIFYGLPPDNATDYVITATKSGYSSLTTTNASGSLQPTYPNQKILSQQSSYTTLPLVMQGSNSLLVETTDTGGAALRGVKVYTKGGYKTYDSTADFSYYFDNYYTNYNAATVNDRRFTTDTAGLAGLQNLVPFNEYKFCNSDNTAVTTTNCDVSGTKYFLAAALPYGGGKSLSAVTVPQYNANTPPATTYAYNGVEYLQKVRLMLTTSSSYPRVYSISPASVKLSAGGRNNFQLIIGGYNLSGASAKLTQGSSTYNATSCNSSTAQLTCYFNLSTVTQGIMQLSITSGSNTLTLPTTPLGGFNVEP